MPRTKAGRSALVVFILWALITPAFSFVVAASPEMTLSIYLKATALIGAFGLVFIGIVWCMSVGFKWAEKGE